MKKKVAHIITTLELGGAQKSALTLLASLKAQGYDISLITSGEGLLYEEALKIIGVPIFSEACLQRALHPISDVRALWRLFRILKKLQPAIVHTHSSKAGILGRWAAFCAGVPHIIHTVHGFAFHQYQSKIVFLCYLFAEWITAKISHLIFVSTHDETLARRFHIGTHTRHHFVHYGIDCRPFQMPAAGDQVRRELGLSSETPVVGMISCLKPQKAPLDFIDVCGLVADDNPLTHFVLVGDGVLRRHVEEAIHRNALTDRVHMLGWRRDIPVLLTAFTVCALTSLWEGSPIIFLEAMASGCPIVATKVGGAADIITNGTTGFLVEPHHPALMARKITYLLHHPEQARAMGEAGRQRVLSTHAFHQKTMVQNIQDIYESF